MYNNLFQDDTENVSTRHSLYCYDINFGEINYFMKQKIFKIVWLKCISVTT